MLRPSMRAPDSRHGLSLIKVALVLAVGTVASVGGYLLLSDRSNASTITAIPSGAEYATASRMSFDVNTTATGELRAKNENTIKSELETESTIVMVVAEGSMVKKGDLLIELNSDQIKTQIDEETLRVESARSDLVAAENAYEIQLSENASKLRQAQLKLDLAELAQKQWELGDLVQKRNDLALALDKAQRELERLTKKFEESDRLFSNGFLSRNEFDLDKIAKLEAEANQSKAVLASKTYEDYQYHSDFKSKQSDVDEAKAELDRVKQQNEIERVTKDADRVNKRRQLQVREDKLKKLQDQLVNSKMFAPQEGLVVYATSMGGESFMFGGGDQGPLKVGRRVFPKENLIVLPDTGEMIASVRVHEALAGKLRSGQAATIRVDAVGGKSFEGSVDSVGVIAESSWRDPNRREYTVKIKILDADKESGLKPSMRCEAQITLDRVSDAVAIPVQAVFREDPVRYVYARSQGQMRRIPVKIGRQSDAYAEITAGIDAGSQVLIREPRPGEFAQVGWDEGQLKTVGLKLGEDGKPVSEGGGPGGDGRGGRRGGGRGGQGGGEAAPMGGMPDRGKPQNGGTQPGPAATPPATPPANSPSTGAGAGAPAAPAATESTAAAPVSGTSSTPAPGKS